MAAWWTAEEWWDTCRGQAWRCFRVTRFAFRDFGLAAHVLGHEDAVAISEFQKFEIDMGVLTVSIIRSAVTYVSGFDKVCLEDDKLKATIIVASMFFMWDAAKLLLTTAAAVISLPTAIPWSTLPASVVTSPRR